MGGEVDGPENFQLASEGFAAEPSVWSESVKPLRRWRIHRAASAKRRPAGCFHRQVALPDSVGCLSFNGSKEPLSVFTSFLDRQDRGPGSRPFRLC